jgi:hypothetical protein
VVWLVLSRRRPPLARRASSRKLSTTAKELRMSTVPTPRRVRASTALGAVALVGACVIVAIYWSEVVAGLSLAVAVLAWLAPQRSRP